MKAFKKYFIVGTNSNAIHDTMNGIVTGELIRCKYCDWFDVKESWCTFHGIEIHNEERGFCCWADPKVMEA